MPLAIERKAAFAEKMRDLLSSYHQAMVVNVDNVTSTQLHLTRKILRGKAEILMGKNTLMRKVIKDMVAEQQSCGDDCPFECLLDICRGNVGLIFFSHVSDWHQVVDLLGTTSRPTAARVGSIAPVNVVVPKGRTGCDPRETAFFQSLEIPTRISCGQIELANDVHLIRKGDTVTASQAALLKKLNIEPFTFGVAPVAVYNSGVLFDAKVLELTDQDLIEKFSMALQTVASVSLAIGFPTTVSVPHSIVNAYKSILSIGISLEKYTSEKIENVKAYLRDPSSFDGKEFDEEPPDADDTDDDDSTETGESIGPIIWDPDDGGDEGWSGDY